LIVLNNDNALRRTVSAIRQKFALLNSKGISASSNLLGFSDYRHRSLDFRELEQEQPR